VFSVANKLALRRGLVLLALAVVSIVAGKLGHPGGVHPGMWDGPL
jgi:hypothetical protein